MRACVCVRVRLGSCLGGFISACAGLCMCVSFLRSIHINGCILYVRRLWGIEQRKEKSIKKTACSLCHPKHDYLMSSYFISFYQGGGASKKTTKKQKKHKLSFHPEM